MVIPVIHCFNDRYVPPAGVAFLSMLEHANPKHDYRLYVMHTDITSEHQSALTEIVRRFPNATLEFMDMKGAEVAASFRRLGVQGHYSAEVLYKLFIPSRFPQYDKVIVTDVDVLYRGDVSEEFVRFDVNSSDYVAGVGGEMGERHFKRKDREYAASFNAEERERLFCVGGGYLFYNLAKMRADGIEGEVRQMPEEGGASFASGGAGRDQPLLLAAHPSDAQRRDGLYVPVADYDGRGEEETAARTG